MKNKKIPMRTCIVSKEKYEKKDLIRIVKTPTGEVIIDNSKNNKTNGRGAYLKKDKDIILKAKASKILDRHLEVKVPDFIYDDILKNI